MAKKKYELLFIDNDRENLNRLEQIAEKNKWSYLSLKSGDAVLDSLDKNSFCVALVELNLFGISGLQLLEWFKTLPSSPEVIIMTSSASVETAVKALKIGAFDYLIKPFTEIDKIASCIYQALEKSHFISGMEALQEDRNFGGDFEDIIGKSPKMRALFEMIQYVSPSRSNIIVLGESGTGKELVAKAIHRNGPRKDKPFIVINCSAMPETLFESELFGYTKGAFTGASADKQGLFEAANGGTAFLDEIGEVPLATQVKLLRVLQEGEIRRLGDTGSRKIDVRLIAATNKDLLELIKIGKFREDLYYRLNVIGLTLPPLRERPEDIPLLAHHFLKKFSKKTGRTADKISIDALQALQNYSWPGNVRELENVMERSVVLSEKDTITAKSLPPKILSDTFYNVSVSEQDLSELSYKEAKKRALNIFNRSYIINLLKKTGGNITVASEKAKMDRSNFKKIIRKYNCQI